jgi:hypothetical protein
MLVKLIGSLVAVIIAAGLSIPSPRQSKLLPLVVGGDVPSATATPLPPEPTVPAPPVPPARNCGGESWFAFPPAQMYVIAALLEAEREGWELCPPEGSEWHRALTVPGYASTSAAASGTFMPPPTETPAP